MPLDSSTSAWIAAVGAGNVSSGRQTTVDNLIVGLKTDGIWAKLDRLWLFAAENTQSALIDLIARDTASPVSSPTFTTDRGYNGNGSSSYVNTNFNPVIDGVNYTDAAACGGFWDITTTAAAAGVCQMGALEAGVYSVSGTTRYSDNNSYWRINSTAGAQVAFAYPGPGLHLVNRYNGFDARLFYNGSSVATSAAGSSATPSRDIFVGAENSAGTASLFATDQIAACLFGGSLTTTEQANLYSRLRTYMATVGVPSVGVTHSAAAILAGSASLRGSFTSPPGNIAISATFRGSGSLRAKTGSSTAEDYVALQRGVFLHYSMATYTGEEFANPNATEDTFNPTALDVGQWIDVVKNFGAKYAVFTVKHIDGFCMWPTTTTPHGIANTTWYATHSNFDITQKFVDECRAKGILPCFYYCIYDANWFGLHSGWTTAQYKTFVEAQITELLSRYGPIGAVWIDATEWYIGGTTPWASAAERMTFFHTTQPGIVLVNNSHTTSLADTDVVEWESINPPSSNTVPTEMCLSIGGPSAWFWKSDTESIYDAATLGNLINSVNASNSTILINFPPNATGIIPTQFIKLADQTRMFLGELPRKTPNNMTSDTAPSPYVASASTEYPGFEAYHSFNSSLSTFWSSSAGSLPAYIQVDLGGAKSVSQYMIQTRQDGVYHQWTAWALAGSNNGSSFTTVDTRSQASVAAGQSIFYELASPAFFRYWRWTITSTASGTDADVANLALFGDEPSIWSSSAILAGIGQLSGLGTQSHPATAFPAGARLSGASALYALGGIPYSISARFGGVGTVLTRGGIQSRISAQLAGVSDLRSRYTIDLHPVVVHDNPVPPDSEFYDPARTPEQNAARNMMLTSGLNDSHRIDLPSGVVIGRSDPGFGPANGFIVEAPLVLTSDGLAIDIAALKILLGLP